MIGGISDLFQILGEKGENASSYSISFNKYTIEDNYITGEYDGGLSPISFRLEIEGGDIVLSNTTALTGSVVILRLDKDGPSFKLIADALNELRYIGKYYKRHTRNHIREFRDLFPDGNYYRRSDYSPILISEVSRGDKPYGIKFTRRLIGDLHFSSLLSTMVMVETQLNELGRLRTKVYTEHSFNTEPEKLSFLYNYSGEMKNLVDSPGDLHLEICGDWIESSTADLLGVPLVDVNRAYDSYMEISQFI